MIDERQVTAFVDTGADCSVIGGLFAAHLRKVRNTWYGLQIRTAGRHLVMPIERCTARVIFHGNTYPVNFVVLQQFSHDVILGMDFLTENGAVIDLKTGSFTLTTEQSSLPECNGYPSALLAILDDEVTIPPRTSTFASIEMKEKSAGVVIVETNAQLLFDRQICVARNVVQLHRGRADILVTNLVLSTST